MFKMQVFWFNACILLAVYASLVGVQSEPVIHAKEISPESGGAIVTRFLKDHSEKVLELAKFHFDTSLHYLYTSYGYKSQMVQRPGMGKYLKDLSDQHWKDGIGIYKTYMQRGGGNEHMHHKFNFKGENHLLMNKDDTRDIRSEYLTTMKHLLSTSKQYVMNLNNLHRMTERRSNEKTTPHHDGAWGHFFEEKLEEEAEKTREIAGHVTDLEKMGQSTMALYFLDSNL